jgi:hypothetical protein
MVKVSRIKILLYRLFPSIILKRERNFRITCKLCNQTYSLFEYPSLPWQRDRYGHEETGLILDKDCICHKIAVEDWQRVYS